MDYFSPDYATARARFRVAVTDAGGELTPLELSAKGPGGEDLTIDVAWFGSPRASRAFVHTSGTHGVEGFAGSAVQLQWAIEQSQTCPRDIAIVFVHVLNPYGMAWLRRVNEHNVDLNRNFLPPGQAYAGAPDGYAQLDRLLNPGPKGSPVFLVRAGWLIARRGMPALRQAVAGGQYVNPQGLFYGGASREEGPRLVERFVRERLGGLERLVAVDMHTGLGPFAVETVLVGSDDDEAAGVDRMEAIFGRRVSSMDPERGPAYRVSGMYGAIYPRLLPDASVSVVGQEFGTYGPLRILRALRAENRWHHHGAGTLDHRSKQTLKEMFAPAAARWRSALLRRSRHVIERARRLLDVP